VVTKLSMLVFHSQSSATCLPRTITRQASRCRSESVLLVFAAAQAAVCKPLGCWPGTPDRGPTTRSRSSSVLFSETCDGIQQTEVEMKVIIQDM
jgi:hypothetical protein